MAKIVKGFSITKKKLSDLFILLSSDTCMASLPSGRRCPRRPERDGYCRDHSVRFDVQST